MSNRSKMIYLAGCMSYFYKNNEMDKAINWRYKLIDQLLDDIAEKCESKWDWFDPTLNFEENYNAVNNKTVLQQNIFYLDKADIMVVNLDKLEESPGTIFEIIYLGLKGKPIIAFGYSEWIKSPHISEYITIHLKEDKIMTYLDNLYYQ